jgi:hypothetical protein
MQFTMESERLAQLVDCKLQILQLLRRLAAQQLDVIAGGDMTNLLKLLAGKQTVMDQLAKLEQQLDPFRGQNPDTRDWPSTEARELCQKNVETCNELLTEIMWLEKQGEGEMVGRRDDASLRLAGMHGASEARHAYVAAAAATGLDLSTEG